MISIASKKVERRTVEDELQQTRSISQIVDVTQEDMRKAYERARGDAAKRDVAGGPAGDQSVCPRRSLYTGSTFDVYYHVLPVFACINQLHKGEKK